MRITGESTADGVLERDFTVAVAGESVPGVLWTPDGPAHALVLMGHGGAQHKRVETLVERARRYAGTLGIAVAAIDAPDHGERTTPERAAAFMAAIGQRIAAGERVAGEVAAQLAARARQAVPEWKATLDELVELGVTAGPVGYWGLSMGTVIGVPLVATEPRISAAVFGLAGLLDDGGAYRAAAQAVTVPVEFAFQWDDEVVSREDGMALFDALGSAEKTGHVNRGGHLGIPAFERVSWERFFTRHLLSGIPATA
jgi:pimeloyl-ACP methyl ester carboxylesterase